MMNSFNYVGKKKNNYFEGWYVKAIDSIKDKSLVIILGITTNKSDRHCFVQIFESGQYSGKYFRYNMSQFEHSNNYVSVGNCVLTPNYLTFKEGKYDVRLEFSNKLDIKRNLFQAGTMGYYKMIPMSSYHETVFLKSEVEGKFNDEVITGIGYIEKTYGTRFPKEYFWVQTNHFSKQNCSLLVSGAKVKVMGREKLGFFAIVNVNDQEYRFATYNSSFIHVLDSAKDRLDLIMFKGKYRCHVQVDIKDSTKLIAPSVDGAMTDEIYESINSELKLSLYNNNKLIFTDKATYVGVENLLSTFE